MTLALTLRKRLLLLLCVFFVAFFMVSVISALVTWKFGASTPALRIVTVLQDVILFIMPALVTALLVTRQPASLLCLDRGLPVVPLFIALATLIASIPLMNFIVALNQNIPLPEGIAAQLSALEDQATAAVEILIGPHTVPNLIMSILIVAVLAGLSEEILFRGGLQRLLSTGGVNPASAIWITAVLFSLLHMQFYGFIPRMLLGAFFGYALLWTRSLWVPVILHITNNTLYLVSEWFDAESTTTSLIETIGTGSDYVSILVSAILVAIGLNYLRKLSSPKTASIEV